MSYQAMTWATKCRVGDAALKLLLLTLANYANEEGICWHSQARISFDTEIPERTLRRKLQELEGMGFIEITARTREDGTRSTSLIRLISAPATMAAGPSIGQNVGSPPAKNWCQPSATWMAGQESSRNTQESKAIVGKKPKKVIAYSVEFENEVWKPYPMKAGTSKANAFKKWADLSESEQQQVKTAIPVYARMEDRKNFTHHLEFFISRRIFETVGIIDGGAAAQSAEPGQFDRKTWENLSSIYSSTNNWHRGWGPEPGERGCAMPPDLQQPFLTAH